MIINFQEFLLPSYYHIQKLDVINIVMIHIFIILLHCDVDVICDEIMIKYIINNHEK